MLKMLQMVLLRNVQRWQVAKSSPKVSKPTKEQKELRTATPKKASSTSTAKKNKKEKADDSSSNGLDTIPEQEISNAPKYPSPKNFRSASMKLGDVVTAKVYQIRAYGLVLELSDGVRGMHKFVENGRKNFEVGEEVLAKCLTFSAKGVPVFSLLD